MAEAVFSLTDQGSAGVLHGGVVVRADASAVASLHRGVDLSLTAGFDAGASGGAGPASASLGVSASAGLDIAAATPLDLFRGAGIVASANLGGEADGFVRADLTLTVDELQLEILQKHTDSWADIARILLDHLDISAGAWARFGVAAEVKAQLSLGGNLVTLLDGSPPGFSVIADYGYGLGFATGGSYTANLGIDKPDAMLDEIADDVVRIATQTIGTSAGAELLPYLDLLVPLAVRAMFRLGVALGEDAGSGATAASDLGASLAHEIQQWTLENLLEGAVTLVSTWMQSALAIVESPGQDMRDVAAALTDAKQALAQADQAASTLDAAIEALDGLWPVAASALFDADTGTEVQDDLASLWALACLADIVSSWDAASGGAFDQTAASAPTDGRVAEFVANAIGKRAGSAVTAADLVTFLVSEARQQRLVGSLPAGLSDVAGWIAGIAGKAPSDLLELALETWDDDAGQSSLLSAATDAITKLVDDQLIPQLVHALGQNPHTEDLAQSALGPLLREFAHVILPGVETLDGTDDTAGPFREQLSVGLIQLLAPPLLTSVNTIAEHALQDGAAWAESSAQGIRDNSTANTIADIEAGLVILNPAFLFVPTPDDLADVLDLVAKVMRDFDSGIRTPGMALVAELLALELGTDPQQLQLQALADQPDAPPNAPQLAKLAEQLAGGSLVLLLEVEAAELVLIAEHFVRVIERLVSDLVTGVKWLVDKLEQFAQWLEQELSQLEQTIAQLAHDIEQIADDIANWMGQLENEAVTWLDNFASDVGDAAASVWDTIASGAEDLGDAVVQGAEDVGGAIVGGLEDLAGDLVPFDLKRDATTSNTTPIDVSNLASQTGAAIAILGQLPQMFHDAAVQVASSGSGSTSAVVQNVQAQIMSADISPVELVIPLPEFPIPFTIIIPADAIRQALLSAVFVESTLNLVGGLTGSVASMLNTQRQADLVQSQIDGTAGDQQTATVVAEMTPGSLGVAVTGAADGGGGGSQVDLSVSVSGANGTFVAETLNVPPRIRVYLNNDELTYSPSQWAISASGATLTLRIVNTAQAQWGAYGFGGLVAVGRPGLNHLHVVAYDGETQSASGRLSVTLDKPPATRQPPYFVPVYTTADGPTALYGYPTWNEFNNQFGALHATSALSSVCPIIDLDNTIHWLGVWQGPPKRQSLHVEANWHAVTALVAAESRAGRQLSDIALVPAVTERWVVVCTQGRQHTALERLSSWDALVQDWQKRCAAGQRLFRLRSVNTPHDGRQWVAAWQPGRDNYALYATSVWSDFAAEWSKLASGGLEITDLHTYVENGVRTWVGVWREGPDASPLSGPVDWPKLCDGFTGQSKRGRRLVRLAGVSA